MMQLLKQQTQENWVLMYVNRWLKAGIEQEDGSINARGWNTGEGREKCQAESTYLGSFKPTNLRI